jgi:hypothetical protein
VLLAALLPAPLARAQASGAVAGRPGTSIADYRKHLESLEALVDSCRKQRTAQACAPAQVGADDQVLWPSGGAAEPREIRYEWLRNLLDRAGKKEQPQKAILPAPVQVLKTKPLSIDELLAQARQRLDGDWQQAGAPAQASPGYAAQRKSLTAILAQREYQGVSQVSARERFQEWLENELVNFLGRLIGYGARSPWIAFTLRALLLGSVCLGLIWALIQIERRSRVRLVPDAQRAVGAPSAREWQLWLKDAHRMAAEGLWRQAIHCLYWASISRLESKRLWPADRARTPREYLLLLPGADPRRTNLTVLTRSFERTWYGGREAGSSDFQAALKLAAAMGVE